MTSTYFYNSEGKLLGSAEGLLSIPLYKGMKITIHGHDAAFEVTEWEYHHGHEGEHAGLHIILKEQPPKWKNIPFLHL